MQVIPDVSVVGLVRNRKLCLVVWGNVIKNYIHNIPLLHVNYCGRFKIPSSLIVFALGRNRKDLKQKLKQE